MYWANFLHIYQPPTQTEAIVRKVASESYRTLVKVLESNPRAKITLNINASLTEQLHRYGLSDVIDGLKRLAERGQIEFTGSAMYHPILPLIPQDEVVRQIQLNSEVNRHYFGNVYQPIGFFPPEMCYSQAVAKTVAGLGFRWMIIDEIAFNGKIGQLRNDVLYANKEIQNLVVFFKERPFSSGFTYGSFPNGELFLDALKNRLASRNYLITGTDGEIYGHHRPGQENLLREIFVAGTPETCTLSELLRLFETKEAASPLPSSWSTWEDEMEKQIPYPQWQYPGHELHRLQWQLTYLAIETIKTVRHANPAYEGARHLLDRGLHSDHFWWASCRPWWSTAMIERGAKDLASAVYEVKEFLSPGRLEQISTLYSTIIETARRFQDTGEAQRIREEYLREHLEVHSELTFGTGTPK